MNSKEVKELKQSRWLGQDEAAAAAAPRTSEQSWEVKWGIMPVS